MNHEDYQKIKSEIKKDVLDEIKPTLQNLGQSMFEIKQTLAPMSDLLNNAKGFNRIAIWFLKSVITIGAAMGVIYALIKWLKQ